MRLLEAVLLMSFAGSCACLLCLPVCRRSRRMPARWMAGAQCAGLLLFLVPLAPLARWLAGLPRTSPAGELSTPLWPGAVESGWWPALPHRLEAAMPPADFAGLLRVLPWLWLAGALFQAVRLWQRGRRFAALLRQGSRSVEDPEILGRYGSLCARMGIGAPIALRICSWVPAPMLCGLRNPVIYLPGRDYAPEELELVLRHELTHLRRRDLWVKALARAAGILHWFNPAVFLLSAELDRSLELACDADVVCALSPEERMRYGHVILASAAAGGLGGVLHAPLVSQTHYLKRRITLMLQTKPVSLRLRPLFVVALLLSLALCTGAGAAVPLSLAGEETPSPSIHVSDTLPVLVSPMEERWQPLTFEGHVALDYPAPQGTPVYAAASGTVVYASLGEDNDGYGNVLLVDHGNGYATLYAHCHQLMAQEGDRVESGQAIASVGQSGASTGNHLHFELRLDGEPLDPAPLLP